LSLNITFGIFQRQLSSRYPLLFGHIDFLWKNQS
jgi:hypothetical protein